MPAAPLPPMTTRQAKKLGKKAVGQYSYTASQMRRADRREELEKRVKREEERENKKSLNKRKREEQREKDRVVKRKLLNEGKIALEDTWGKVTASQPRLSNFFNAPPVSANRCESRSIEALGENAGDAPIDGTGKKENEYRSQDSQEETLVNQALLIHQAADIGDEISDIDLLKLISSQDRLSQHTPPASVEKTMLQTRSQTRASISTARIMSHSILKRKRTPTPEPVDDGANDFPDSNSDTELKVAEDETAEELPHAGSEFEAMVESFSSPSKSFRSVLSEMSVANVNTRAQDKPDTTSAQPESGLATPSKPRDSFSSFDSVDVEDDYQLTWDKENSDPLQTPEKCRGKKEAAVKGPGKMEAGPSSSAKKAPPRGFSVQDNFEDIYDFDFHDGQDDLDDFEDFNDDVDDATLMTLSTQKPKGDRIVDLYGSPRKLNPNKDAVVKATPLHFTPGKMLPPPPPNSKLATPPSRSRTEKSSAQKREDSLSFASVGDDDLLDIAEQLEQELSQKGKAVAESEFKIPALRKKRTLPWQKNPLPPPSTQDYLMMMADEVDAELGA